MRIVRYYPRALVGDGGMTNAVRRWSQYCVRAGADVTVAYDEGVAPHPEDGVRWRRVCHSGRKGTKVPRGMSEVIRDADLLVLHSGWTLRNIRAAAVARKLRVPYLLEPRGAYDPHIVARKRPLKSVWWRAMERKLVHEARAVHIFFEHEKNHLFALGYRGPFVIASNGVDLPEGGMWDGGSGGYLLWLGRFDPDHKGLDLLLDGLALIHEEERPRLRLNGPDWRARKDRVRRSIDAKGLTRWASVGPPVYGPDKRELLVRAKGFVYPSRWDACPNSVLESVSLGIPTLVTPYPLGRYFAENGGAILAEASPEGLAKGLSELDSDRAVLGERGAQMTREQLTWDHVAADWLDQVAALL